MNPRNTTTGIHFRDLPSDYLGLVGVFMPRPLHDVVDVENATEIIDAMAGHELSVDQQDYLDLLSDLVEKYESAHRAPRNRKSPLKIVKALLDEHQLNASDLGRLLGDRTLGPKILSGQRKLSKSHIKALSKRFALDPACFLE